MSLKLYMDVHVQFAITDALRRRGIDVLTAQDDQHDTEEDSVLVDRATQLGRLLFTRDEDFVLIAAQRQATGLHFSGILYAHQLRATFSQCIADLEMIAVCCDMDDFANKLDYLPLR